MSHSVYSASGRSRFPVKIKCPKCRAEGSAVWEENAGLDSRGPMSSLEELSAGFYRRISSPRSDVPQIVCGTCDAALD